jgi:large subunit ribosomal protein L11
MAAGKAHAPRLFLFRREFNNEEKGANMARQMTAQIRLQVTGGQATPAPPVGPALGQHGVNIGAFVTQFNDRTKDMRGITVPVVITVYSDRSFEFVVKSPPAAVLLKQAAGIPLEKKKGGELIPAEEKARGKYKGFSVTNTQVRDIAQKKFQDLNARDLDHAVRIIEGTARSMGLVVES